MENRNIEELIDQYDSAYAKIRLGIEGLTEKEMAFKPSPEKWSINEIVVHLCDSEINAVQRMRRIIAEENPLITAYDQNRWAEQLGYQHLDAKLALVTFGMLRECTVPILRKLSSDAWDRKGNHEEQGTITLLDLLKTYAEHGDRHLEQIMRNKQLLKS